MEHALKKILITNDDGFDAIGLNVLKSIASKLSDNVYVVSPKFNQSAKSRSITLKNKIYFEKKAKYEWIVDGTPTDCIIFALNHLMKMDKPDLILSGINAGSNIGDEVSYSGTVAAAMEGALRGIHSVALSQFGGDNNNNSYSCSQNNSFEIIKYVINLKIDHPVFFNVNFPLSISNLSYNKNFLFTELASQKKSDEIIVNEIEKSFKIGRMLNHDKCGPNSDLETLKQGKISITPLSLDLTNIDVFKNLNQR